MSSSTPPLIPPGFFFRPALLCPRVDDLPGGAKGGPVVLPEACTLPSLGELDGRSSWAEVRVGWNPGGLGVSVEVSGKPGAVVHVPGRPEETDGAQLWIDTRDTRDIHRASRHCHRFHVAVVPGPGRALEAVVRQLKIHRATADAPPADPELIRAAAGRTRTGYRVGLFVPASALHGFDPETNRRLGFTYRVTDPDRGDQFLGVGREFPVGEDPSLWATLELCD